jgi:predicted AAA+ superfamily ATPase
VLARPKAAKLWFASYIQSYLEKDVRSISAVQDVAKFRRFMGLVASRHGQIVNKTELAAALGMSAPGVGLWLDILEATGIILLVQPYFNNLGKRIIKSPKLYVADSGLACHLLGIDTNAELEKSPFLGAIFEGLIAAEIAKAQLNNGQRRELYFFRDQQGLEVDFIIPKKNGAFQLVEVKATKTPLPSMAKPMQSLMKAWGADASMKNYKLDAVLIHRPKLDALHATALLPNIRAISWQNYIESMI